VDGSSDEFMDACVPFYNSIKQGPLLSYLHAKKPMPTRIMNSASMNIMNSVGIFNDSVAMNSILRELYWSEQ
jgi:hypothetical protein